MAAEDPLSVLPPTSIMVRLGIGVAVAPERASAFSSDRKSNVLAS